MILPPSGSRGVSGGAGTGAGFISRRGAHFIYAMCEAFSDLDSNMDPHEIGETGLSPHQSIYPDVVSTLFDAQAMDAIPDGPVFQVLLEHPPSGHLAKLTGTAATLAYEAELHLIGSPHFNWTKPIGVTSSMADARQAARDGTLVDLICAAAVIPPLFDTPAFDGKAVIDGGMADQAPLPDPDGGDTLILLTLNYDKLPDIGGRDYIAPEKAVTADKIDFTDLEKTHLSWNTGAMDGHAFLENWR